MRRDAAALMFGALVAAGPRLCDGLWRKQRALSSGDG